MLSDLLDRPPSEGSEGGLQSKYKAHGMQVEWQRKGRGQSCSLAGTSNACMASLPASALKGKGESVEGLEVCSQQRKAKLPTQ